MMRDIFIFCGGFQFCRLLDKVRTYSGNFLKLKSIPVLAGSITIYPFKASL